jgi:hypothetical protein
MSTALVISALDLARPQWSRLTNGRMREAIQQAALANGGRNGAGRRTAG